jgi:hypothetical protein
VPEHPTHASRFKTASAQSGEIDKFAARYPALRSASVSTGDILVPDKKNTGIRHWNRLTATAVLCSVSSLKVSTSNVRTPQ